MLLDDSIDLFDFGTLDEIIDTEDLVLKNPEDEQNNGFFNENTSDFSFENLDNEIEDEFNVKAGQPNGIDLLVEELTASKNLDTETTDLIDEDEDSAFDVDSDEELFRKLTDELSAKGFENLSDCDYNQFEILSKRAESFDDTGNTFKELAINDFIQLHEKFRDFSKKVLNSYSLSIKQNDLTKLKNHITTNDSMMGISKPIQSYILAMYSNEIENHLKTGKSFEQKEIYEIANEIYQELKYNKRNEKIISSDFDKFIEYVETTLNSITLMQKQLKEQELNAKSYKSVSVKYLLSDELDIIDKIFKTYKENNQSIDLGFIKQVFIDSDNNAYFICEKCGKKIKINDYVATCIYVTSVKNGKNHVLIFPKLFTCNCRFNYVFMHSDLNILEKFIKDNLNSELSGLTLRLTSMANGSAMLKYEVPLIVLKDLWSYLIVNSYLDNSDDKALNDSNKDFVNIAESDLEYRNAVNKFYQLLKTLDPNKIPKVFKNDEKENDISNVDLHSNESNPFVDNTLFADNSLEHSSFMTQIGNEFVQDSAQFSQDDDNFTIINERSDMLNYKEIAIFFCKVLSINYLNVRNKALFSIVFYINNSKILKEYLDMSKIFRLEGILKFINNNIGAIDKDIIPTEEELSELSSIAFAYANNEQISVLLNYDNKSLSRNDAKNYCKELFKIIKSEQLNIENEINRLNQNREKIIKELWQCIDALSFLQIINITQFDCCDVINICGDEKIYRLIDELVDRMIVSNYSEDFFEKFKTFKIFSNNIFNNTLTITTESNEMKKSLFDAVINLCTDKLLNVNKNLIQESFKMVSAMTQGSLDICKKLNKAFNSADYYKFCQSVVDFCENYDDIDTLISKEYTIMLKDFCYEFYPKAKDLLRVYKTPYDYYLQGFDKDEIELAKTYISDITFNRYMPIRNKDEGVIDYLDRYLKIQSNNEINRFKFISKDYGKEFDKITDYYGMLFSCSALYDTAYHSFTKGTFITQFVKIVKSINSCLPGVRDVSFSKKIVGSLLGISEPILNLIDNEIDSNNQNLDFNNFIVLLKALNGIYVTSASKRIDLILDQFYKETIKSTDDLEKVLNKIDIKNLLMEIASSDEKEFILYDDIPENTDYNDAVKELFLYSEYEGLKEYL